MKNFVVIGNGAAAVGCIEGIRRIDGQSAITVVSGEDRHVYCRPLISYYLEGKTDLERIKYRPDGFYEDMGCRVLYGKKAAAIDAGARLVRLEDGGQIAYDALCVAAGSSPFIPPFDGLETVTNKFSFLTLDDALSLEQAVCGDARVLIVGAGLIGLKCAEGLAGRVGSVTVCDLAQRILPSILDDDGAAILQRHLERNGLTFLLGDSAVRFEADRAYMKSGKEVPFDILVLAVGVRPNISLVKDAGAKVGRGIVTDAHMAASLPGVYAAGDCVESFDVSSQTSKVLAILPNAYMQGTCAGVNMAGGDAVFEHAIAMNSIGFFGLHAMTAGSYYDASQGGALYEQRGENKLKRLFSKDGYLTGFMLIGDTDRAGIYTSMVRNRVPLETIDYELVKKSPSLLPFGKEYRGNKLGGVV